MSPEEKVLEKLKEAGVDLVLTLPCDRVKCLHNLLTDRFLHVPLTREEEGVGIAAGWALGGGRPVMLIQNSGLGNMINALASLTGFYRLPLFIMMSWRGVYKEGIDAQKPMGRLAPKLLDAMDIEFEEINNRKELDSITALASKAFDRSRITAALLSPQVWETSTVVSSDPEISERRARKGDLTLEDATPKYTRFEMIQGLKQALMDRVVVSNIGVPGKELYHTLNQPSNFYMLGSLGMATPIGLGMALRTNREVIVIDGDGSLLMNPGSLATVSVMKPPNLTILALDNGVHGSTGGQPTAAAGSANLAIIAGGMGIENVHQAATPEEALVALKQGVGPRFIHTVIKPGNKQVPNIPLTPEEIKKNVMRFLNP